MNCRGMKSAKRKSNCRWRKLATGFEALERHFHDPKVDKLDGLRLDWPDKWLLVPGEQHGTDRPSHRRSPHRRRSPAIMPSGRRRVDGIVARL